LYTHTYENDPYLAQFRSSHVFEDPFLWGNFNLFPGLVFGYQPTPAELLLSQRMTDYWSNFAKVGDPNGPGLSIWPPYNTTTEPALTLDDQIGVATTYHVAQCQLLDTISAPFDFPGFNHGRKTGLFDSQP
jgi:carboxylesterase type B